MDDQLHALVGPLGGGGLYEDAVETEDAAEVLISSAMSLSVGQGSPFAEVSAALSFRARSTEVPDCGGINQIVSKRGWTWGIAAAPPSQGNLKVQIEGRSGKTSGALSGWKSQMSLILFFIQASPRFDSF